MVSQASSVIYEVEWDAKHCTSSAIICAALLLIQGDIKECSNREHLPCWLQAQAQHFWTAVHSDVNTVPLYQTSLTSCILHKANGCVSLYLEYCIKNFSKSKKWEFSCWMWAVRWDTFPSAIIQNRNFTLSNTTVLFCGIYRQYHSAFMCSCWQHNHVWTLPLDSGLRM